MKKISNILQFILFALPLVLFGTAMVLYTTFHGVDFRTVIMQMTVPSTIGNPVGTFKILFTGCLWGAPLFFISLFYYHKHPKTQSRICFSLVLTMLVLCISYTILPGFSETVQEAGEYSTIYEEYYVSPEDVKITFPEGKNNLLVIYLESMEQNYKASSNGHNYIPHLTELQEESHSFSSSSGAGILPVNGAAFTLGALISSSSGITYNFPTEYFSSGRNYDNLEKSTFRHRSESVFMNDAVVLGDILKSAGYYNEFICGTDADFAGRAEYYKRHNYDKISDIKILTEEYSVEKEIVANFDAISDAYMYDILKERIKEAEEKEQPWHIDFLSVNTHQPNGYLCEFCSQEYESDIENAISCADKLIYNFIEWAKTQEWYDNTTIVILGDHPFMGKNPIIDDVEAQRSTINIFINSKGAKNATEKPRDFCQLDMFPTFLGAIGAQIEGDRLGLGANLYSEEATLVERLNYEYVNSQLGMRSQMHNNKFRIEV